MPKTEEKYTVEDRLEKRYTYPEFMKEFFPNINPADFEEKVQVTETTGSPQPASATADGSGADFVNPTRAYEETLTRDELLARLDDQARIIHELYTGKHGVIPHPAEVWKAGLWEIYKVDEHQASAERVGEVGELKSLRAQLQAAEDTVRGLRLLCGRATDVLQSVALPFSYVEEFKDELRQAAKVGDE